MKTTLLQSAVDAWVASNGDPVKEQAVHDILDTPEYKALPYLERNRPFLTASKLKEFAACPYHAWLKYVDEVPSPVEDDADYFIVGQAVDDLLTLGEEAFGAKYEVVARRSKDAPKVQLTNSQGAIVQNAAKEYLSREFFPKQPTKKNVLCLVHGMPCKAELDHFDAENRRIGDIKTTASITTFNPMSYAIQFGFYSLLIALRFEESVDAELYVVDKGSDFSRSHKWVLSHATLREQHYSVERLVKQWKECMEVGIWPHCNLDTEEGRKIAWSSDYWTVCPFCKSMPETIL